MSTSEPPAEPAPSDGAARSAQGEAVAPDASLLELERALENAVETLGTLGTAARRFSYDSQDLVFQKVNDFVADLREVEEKAKKVTTQLPAEVVEAIDKGRNPEQVTYQMLEACAEANNSARGKLLAMQQFRDALDEAAESHKVNNQPGASQTDL